jgi:hypothetical protein
MASSVTPDPGAYRLAEFVTDCQVRGVNPLATWWDIRADADFDTAQMWVNAQADGVTYFSDDDLDYFNFELHAHLHACFECGQVSTSLTFLDGIPYGACHAADKRAEMTDEDYAPDEETITFEENA